MLERPDIEVTRWVGATSAFCRYMQRRVGRPPIGHELVNLAAPVLEPAQDTHQRVPVADCAPNIERIAAEAARRQVGVVLLREEHQGAAQADHPEGTDLGPFTLGL